MEEVGPLIGAGRRGLREGAAPATLGDEGGAVGRQDAEYLGVGEVIRTVDNNEVDHAIGEGEASTVEALRGDGSVEAAREERPAGPVDARGVGIQAAHEEAVIGA